MTGAARPGKLPGTMIKNDRQKPQRAAPSRPPAARLEPARRFARTDGRFDLPVVTGRTPQEVARRLA